jgi:hypothetical protein
MKRVSVFVAVMAATVQSAAAQPSTPRNAPAQTFLNRQNWQWQVDTGADYSSGRYGAATTTDVWSIPLDGKVQAGPFRLEGTIPYVSVTGPGVVADGVVVGSGPVNTRSGIGDLNLGAAYLLSKDADWPALEFEGIVKVPTAATGLGTGKTDFTLQANAYHYVTPKVMLFGSLGYQWLSSFSTFVLENGVQASAGANFVASTQFNLGMSASYRQEYFRGLGDAFTVSPYALWNIANNWRVTGYGTVGAGKASPEFGLGMRLIYYRS